MSVKPYIILVLFILLFILLFRWIERGRRHRSLDVDYDPNETNNPQVHAQHGDHLEKIAAVRVLAQKDTDINTKDRSETALIAMAKQVDNRLYEVYLREEQDKWNPVQSSVD